MATFFSATAILIHLKCYKNRVTYFCLVDAVDLNLIMFFDVFCYR